MEDIGKKYKVILDYEESFTRVVARRVQMMKHLSVWAFMIPFIFILSFLRHKRSSVAFSLNFLFTKKLALEDALDIAKRVSNGRTS